MGDSENRRSVFVVHGRNLAVRDAMFEFLRSLDLKPIEWTRAVQLTGEGAPYIGQILDAAFSDAAAVVVLMTPDEVAYLQPKYGDGLNDPETQPAAQARPNVLFEAGMALGRDPKRTILVEVGDLRPFSDVAGRHAVRLSNESGSRQELANRLRTAGCDVDTNGKDWHQAGDFSAPAAPGGGLPLGRRIPSPPDIKPSIHFDVRYFNKGGNQIDKLQVINRGGETAYDVEVMIPNEASLSLFDGTGKIVKIPGGGKSVTLDVWNSNRVMGGGPTVDAFEISVSGKTEAGDVFSQDVFIDVNG
jgi:hypothetical protein